MYSEVIHQSHWPGTRTCSNLLLPSGSPGHPCADDLAKAVQALPLPRDAAHACGYRHRIVARGGYEPAGRPAVRAHPTPGLFKLSCEHIVRQDCSMLVIFSPLGATCRLLKLARHMSSHKVVAMGASRTCILLPAARFFLKIVEIILLVSSIIQKTGQILQYILQIDRPGWIPTAFQIEF